MTPNMNSPLTPIEIGLFTLTQQPDYRHVEYSHTDTEKSAKELHFSAESNEDDRVVDVKLIPDKNYATFELHEHEDGDNWTYIRTITPTPLNDKQRTETTSAPKPDGRFFITAMTAILTLDTKFDSVEAKNHDSRCFGYFEKLSDAEEAVRKNRADMWETMYEYIVIERIGQGIHPVAEPVGWFQFDIDSRTYQPITVGRTGFTNYALG